MFRWTRFSIAFVARKMGGKKYGGNLIDIPGEREGERHDERILTAYRRTCAAMLYDDLDTTPTNNSGFNHRG